MSPWLLGPCLLEAHHLLSELVQQLVGGGKQWAGALASALSLFTSLPTSTARIMRWAAGVPQHELLHSEASAGKQLHPAQRSTDEQQGRTRESLPREKYRESLSSEEGPVFKKPGTTFLL